MDIKSKILVHSCPPSKFGGLAHFQTLAQTDNRHSLLKKVMLEMVHRSDQNIINARQGGL